VFERLTREVRAAVLAARDIACDEGDAEVSPMHLLAALAGGDGRVAALLEDHGIDLESIAEARGFGRSDAPAPDRRPLDDDDAEALRALGIDLGAIRRAVEASFGEGALDGPAATDTTGGDHPDPTRGDHPDPPRGDHPSTDTPHDLRPHDEVVTDEPLGRGRRRFSFAGNPRFAPTSKKSLELALREAIRDRSKDVREEHMALGILRADDNGIRTLLHALGVDVPALRHDLEGRRRRSA
jgi:hypothetical protein